MEVGFRFEKTYEDNDLLQLRVSAWNGFFGGAADIYVGIGRLKEVANLLRGFPSYVKDDREFTLGAFTREFAGGGISLHFFCSGGAAHVFVESKIESTHNAEGKAQSATLLLPTEAAAIDAFVEDLYRVDSQQTRVASLKGMVFAGRL